MVQLTDAEHAAVFCFLEDVNASYPRMEQAALAALQQHFHFSLTAYVVYRYGADGRYRVERVRSDAVPQDDLSRYKSVYFRSDPMWGDVDARQNADASAVFYYEHEETAAAADGYDAFCAKNQLSHEAVLGLHSPLYATGHLLKVFKTREQGPFTEHECALLAEINNAYRLTKKLYTNYVLHLRREKAISAFMDEAMAGCAVLDESQRLMWHNGAFVSLSAAFSAATAPDQIALDLVAQAGGEEYQKKKSAFTGRLQKNGYLITVNRQKVSLGYDVELLTFLSIRRDDGPVSAGVSLGTGELQMDLDLTNRESEIALLILRGYSNGQIADSLQVEPSTVKSHIRNIFSKCGVTSRKELMRKLRALRAG